MPDEKIITLAIEKLAGLGDGMGVWEGRKVFVPYTLAGDVVRARIVKETADATHAALEEVLTPGEGRTAPVCRHFSHCGGCTLQHMGQGYADFKRQAAREAVRKAGYDMVCVQPLVALPPASRRRAELKVANGKLGYYALASHDLVDIAECKVLEPELEALVLRFKTRIEHLPEVTDIQINGVDGGYDICLSVRHFAETPDMKDDAVLRCTIRTKEKSRTVFQSGPVILTLGGVPVDVPPGAFLQASRRAQEIITAEVTRIVGDAAKILDLFAGIGTYAFPLLAHADVSAIEGDAAMVAAMGNAATRAGRKNLRARQRDLFQNPALVEELNRYDAAVINPPRAGAKAQCEALAKSKLRKIAMVSCNPATFARDARILKEGGYRLERVTPVDQFVFSPHLELVAEFVR